MSRSYDAHWCWKTTALVFAGRKGCLFGYSQGNKLVGARVAKEPLPVPRCVVPCKIYVIYKIIRKRERVKTLSFSRIFIELLNCFKSPIIFSVERHSLNTGIYKVIGYFRVIFKHTKKYEITHILRPSDNRQFYEIFETTETT